MPSKGSMDLRLRLGRPAEAGLRARFREEPEAPEVVRRMLERYIDLVERELATLTFSEAEASLICEALNGTWLLEPASVRLFWAEVADAIRLNELDRKWGVDGDALVTKLQALTPGQRLAVVDAVERFWLQPEAPAGERLREVGLVRDSE